MDTNKIRALLDRRDDIDRELAEALTAKKSVKCSACGEEGHTARTCTARQSPPPPPPPQSDAFAGQ
jgi:hypothetical protein